MISSFTDTLNLTEEYGIFVHFDFDIKLIAVSALKFSLKLYSRFV